LPHDVLLELEDRFANHTLQLPVSVVVYAVCPGGAACAPAGLHTHLLAAVHARIAAPAHSWPLPLQRVQATKRVCRRRLQLLRLLASSSASLLRCPRQGRARH
jgi:hypothetical protein